MTNTSELRGRIAAKGFTVSSLARLVCMSRPTLRKKIENKGEFSANEIIKICKALEIPKEKVLFYFFAEVVPKMETA